MAGWQTLTRLDLTGPFNATTNTGTGSNPPPAAPIVAGYRQTIGDPGASGIAMMTTILELFDGSSSATAAISPTVQAYDALGYTREADATSLHLGPRAIARSGPVSGSAGQGALLIWRSANLLVIEEFRGPGATLATAAEWVQLVQDNAQANRGTGPTPPGWSYYVDPKWGYAVSYPPDWFDIGSFGVPNVEGFANEKVGAPLQLDQKGIILNISTGQRDCPSPPASDPGRKQLAVGDQSIVRTTGHAAPPAAEESWTIGADVPVKGVCISFRFVALTQSARDANLEIADQIMSSFTAP